MVWFVVVVVVNDGRVNWVLAYAVGETSCETSVYFKRYDCVTTCGYTDDLDIRTSTSLLSYRGGKPQGRRERERERKSQTAFDAAASSRGVNFGCLADLFLFDFCFF